MNTFERHAARPSRGDEHLAELLGAVTNLNDRLGDLQRGIRTLNGAQMLGARPVPLNELAVSQPLSNAAGRIAGYVLINKTGGPAEIRLRDGRDANGQTVLHLHMADFLSFGFVYSAWFLPGGVGFGDGLFLEWVAGGAGLTGSFFLAPAAPLT